MSSTSLSSTYSNGRIITSSFINVTRVSLPLEVSLSLTVDCIGKTSSYSMSLSLSRSNGEFPLKNLASLVRITLYRDST